MIIYKELSYKINGLCFKTHKELGRFRSEKSYADFIEHLLLESKIPYLREVVLPPSFEGELPQRNRPDFVIDDKIILDLKAKSVITKEDYFQMKRYLAVSQKKLGIIINFRQPHIYPKRVAC